MQRKKKPNGLLITGLISALASLAIVAVAPSFAGDNEPKEKPAKSSQKSSSDHDGDADSDSKTSYTEDNDTNDGGTKNNVSDSGDNAHPSGKDRSVEKGKSGNQGKSESNPDDSKGPMRYEGARGADKPNGPGGTDLADQDGNNGCGNDDDFNDDNNGWCGRPKKSRSTTGTKPSDAKTPKSAKSCPDRGSMVQGKSCSEPDNDGRGPDRNESGRDKVEDGNNGCGNDVDKRDDNEGWCGHKPKDEVQGGVIGQPTCPNGSVMPTGGNCGEGVPCPAGTVMDASGNCLEVNPSTPEDDVLGEQIEKDKAAAKPEGPSVLGIRLSPALNEPIKLAGAVLPFTGGDVLVFLVLALALLASGILIMRSSKRSHLES